MAFKSLFSAAALLAFVARGPVELPSSAIVPTPGLPPQLEIVDRATFRAWGAHGAFEPSLDAAFIYFGENGPDGLVVKRASLSDGAVEVVASTPGEEAYAIASVPNDPGRLVLGWQMGLGAASPYGVSILDLRSREERKLDVGSNGGDGTLRVSPSGRFLATGAAVISTSRERPWHPTQIAVFSVASGRREFVYKLTPQVSGTVDVAWTTDDVVVIDRVAFRRDRNGRWSKGAGSGTVVAQTGRFQRCYPGELLAFRAPWGEGDLRVSPQALFGDRGRQFFAYSLSDKGIAIAQAKGPDKWDTIEVAVLKWKPKERV